ncbi:MAG: DAK2 domain-containing protein, partial [Tissierellia bacterium]|nr:DAK2 domain-containing protein [Tissierellia bacterium]
DKAIAEEKEKELKEEEKKYGFIAVSSGSGLDKIFKQFGVDEIISGGQTMNPSTEDIMKAIDKINAENIYIFPNNGNIILSANQARDLSEKNIYVIETKSIPQGFTSLLAFEEDNSPEENFQIMTEAIDEVKSGQITYAIKDTEIKGKKIKKDDIIGIVDKEIKAVSKKLNKTALDLIETMVDEDSCLITVYYGLDVKDTEVNDLERKLKRKYDDLDIEIVEGDQPIYYYLISVE